MRKQVFVDLNDWFLDRTPSLASGPDANQAIRQTLNNNPIIPMTNSVVSLCYCVEPVDIKVQN